MRWRSAIVAYDELRSTNSVVSPSDGRVPRHRGVVADPGHCCIGALVGGAVSTLTASRLDQRRWRREDLVYWRTEKRRAYATTLANLIEARDGLLRLSRVSDGRRSDAAEAMRELSARAAPVNFETRMIAPAAVEAAIAEAAVALEIDYDDSDQVTTERVENFRDLVRAVRQQMRADLGIDQ